MADRATRGLDRVIPKLKRSSKDDYCSRARDALKDMTTDIMRYARNSAFNQARDAANEADIIAKSLKHCGRSGKKKRGGK